MRKYEKYDVDEYFIKFGDINPILLYANESDKYNFEKLKFQKKLIEKFTNNNISKDKMINIYKSFIEYSNQNKDMYSIVHFNFGKELEELKKSHKEYEIDKINNLLKSLEE